MIIGTVPYINGLPLTKHLNAKVIPLPPSQLTNAILTNQIDVGLLPTFGILKHNLLMHPDAGIIGCDGAVKSVGLFTRSYINNLEEVRTLYMDQESLTSVYLTKILFKKYFNISLYDVEFVHHDNRDIADAQLLIGDKALFHDNNKYRFWDLGQIWKDLTKTGFMFASWASKRKLNDNELAILMKAKELGLANINEICAEIETDEQEQVKDYFKNNIIYQPTESIKQGLQQYRNHLMEYFYIEPVRKAA